MNRDGYIRLPNKLDRDAYVWNTLEKDEIGKCVECGKKIWKYWKTYSGRKGDMFPQEMDFCAPCYFKK